MGRSNVSSLAGKTGLTEARTELLRIVDSLPPAGQAQVLNFARFLAQRTNPSRPEGRAEAEGIVLHAASARTLFDLTALVALGGDAVAETEALYDDNGAP